MEINHELDPGFRRCGHHCLAVDDGRRKRFLHHHMLACLQQADRRISMKVIGRRYGHGLNIARSEAFDIGCPSASEFLGEEFGSGFVEVADDN